MDRELKRRKPAESPHREVVREAVVDSKLFGKVVQRVKIMAGIKPLLILAVTALHLAVVMRGVGADELMPDTKLSSGGLK